MFYKYTFWLLAASVCCATAKAAVQNSFYSESTYYEKYDLVTESRLRTLYNWQESENLESGAYLGASLQYQSPAAAEKYYDSTMTPQVGLQFRFIKKLYLQLQAGMRTVIDPNSQAENKTEWDPRTILSAGDMLYASPSSKAFAEYYGEISYVPRIDSTPVSTGWLKLGYRFSPWKNIYADPYAEAFARESRNNDLGPTLTQWRTGARLLWWTPSWNVATLLYHSFNNDSDNAAIEGLFVVGGNF